ncbi:phosphonate ABC transporter ATP-binding protein [Thermophilibacter provencensis]|uniref:phosphonate ABC transporter ATP-binding protein n=1 Tax=Thermophilibacter provencensis TaxID=1852386 RepID=UPI0029421ED8|nr:phosphonate ABC transporter ATP-binding protein [Thermophilibacter provencensis]
MDTSTQLLVVTGLGKAYQTRNGDKGQRALRDVDFTAESGELITVIGPSGAGKSTFLRCINRLIEPTDGTVTFCGQDITHLSRGQLRPVHRQIAMIFQNYNLVYRLTAIQNVLHGRLGYKNVLAGSLGLYTEEEKIHAFELLDEVGLGEFAYRRADQLSGGQKQRVGIARALMQEPKIMLCDEPIASLDPKSSRMVMEQLRRLSRSHGITCIVNLHQVDFALEFSDRIVGLRAGEKVFDGSPAECTPDVIRGIYEGDAEAMVDVAVGVEKNGQIATPVAAAMGEAR